MNVSQHAFVPYSSYVQGYYNSSKELLYTDRVTLRSNKLMIYPKGINTFQLFNFPRYSPSFATLRSYDPFHSVNDTNEIVQLPYGQFFSTTRSIYTLPLDVRVVGWNDPNYVFTLNFKLKDDIL